jgi:hypothetical protein
LAERQRVVYISCVFLHGADAPLDLRYMLVIGAGVESNLQAGYDGTQWLELSVHEHVLYSETPCHVDAFHLFYCCEDCFV